MCLHKRNIISVSCLDRKGFCFTIKNNCCSIYLNEIFYGSAHRSNGLYVLDLDTPVYNIDTKPLKTKCRVSLALSFEPYKQESHIQTP